MQKKTRDKLIDQRKTLLGFISKKRVTHKREIVI